MRLDVRRETENKSRIIHSPNHPFLIFPLNLCAFEPFSLWQIADYRDMLYNI